MAYDEQLATRVGEVLPDPSLVAERKMFGGLAFLVRGNMSCGIIGDRLMVRVSRDSHEAALAQPHVRAMDFTGKPMRGFVYVEPAGIATAADLLEWVHGGVAFAASLPSK